MLELYYMDGEIGISQNVNKTHRGWCMLNKQKIINKYV